MSQYVGINWKSVIKRRPKDHNLKCTYTISQAGELYGWLFCLKAYDSEILEFIVCKRQSCYSVWRGFERLLRRPCSHPVPFFLRIFIWRVTPLIVIQIYSPYVAIWAWRWGDFIFSILTDCYITARSSEQYF